jgi:hypothetical protein
MAARVTGWLLTTNLRTGPGGRVSIGDVLRDRQPRRFPLDAPSLGMAVLVEGEPGPHELGFALSHGDVLIAPPLIVSVELSHERSWVFLERGPHKLPGPGTYRVDISLDGEMAEEGEVSLETFG